MYSYLIVIDVFISIPFRVYLYIWDSDKVRVVYNVYGSKGYDARALKQTLNNFPRFILWLFRT